MKLKDIEYLFHKELDALFDKDEVSQFFYLCIESFYKLSRLDVALDTNLSITVEEQPKIIEALEQLKQQKPIQYILGETEFYGLPFKVSEATLIPRPETEELVSLIIENVTTKSKINILDIGTGSGCIAITLAKKLKNANVFALDVSKEALQIAQQNAVLNNVNITFITQSILDDFNPNTEFDIIVSNPPYVRELEKQEIQPNVLNHEPHLALFVANHNPLIFYKAITEFAEKYLTKNGQLYFEINEYLGKEMKDLVSTYNFKNIEIVKDIFTKNRMLKADLNTIDNASNLKSIAIFCGSSLGTDKALIQNTYNLGKTLATKNITLVYGGAKIGLMGKVAEGVLENNGKAIGIIPEFLQTKEIASHNLTQLITTKNMHDRKVLMYEKSDGFIIIPGGFGTMDEFFEISTWGQLGLHSKPIGILNTNGFYNSLLAQIDTMVTKGFLAEENQKAILVSDSIEDLLEKMNTFKPLPKPKWLDVNKI